MNGLERIHNQNKSCFRKVAALGLLLSCLFGVVACSDEEVPDPQLYTADGVPYSYVSVGFSLAMNPVTKANPNGGEGGDGLEKGQLYENTVNNIHLFFYNVKDPTKDGKDGVNMPGDTAILAHKYLESGDFKYSDVQATTHAIPVENLLVGNSYHVLAVVNAGETFGKDFAKLDDLQKAKVTKLYTYDEQKKEYSNFLMSSERDEYPRLTIYGNNSESNPASTEIYVERVTARVDYRLADDFSREIKNSADEVIATAEITGAMLVNTLKDEATSYLLKRVTKENADFNNTDVIFLGDEKLSDDKTASNYVIDPYAGNKTKDNFVEATYFPSIGYDNAATWEGLFITETSITDDDGETWNRIGYPKENVNATGSKDRSTGVVFRAEIRLPDNTPAKTTFFMWNGSIYKTLEKAMEAFDENGWKLVTSATYWNEINTYGDLKTKFIDRLKSDDPTGYKAYLQKQVEGKTDTEELTNEVKSTLRWTYYMEHTNYYTSSEGVARVDVGTGTAPGTTRRLLHAYNVRTYKEGVCYYTYWIKHANDQKPENDLEYGDGSGVMEYAIVRNNVYKLSVKGMGSIGGDIPGDESLMINFSVKDWTLLNAEEIKLTDNTQEGGGV